MEIRPRECVIIAKDYDGLVEWYQDALGFEVIQSYSKNYHYSNLKTSGGFLLGIALANEMGVAKDAPKPQTTAFQVEVDDVRVFLDQIKKHGGSVPFGPSFVDGDGFWYGGFEDPEGNPWWVVDKNCP